MFLDVREWLEWPEFSPLIFMMFAKHLLSTFNVQYFSQQNLFLTTQTFNTFDFVFKSKINIFLTFSGVSFQQACRVTRLVRVVWLWSYLGQENQEYFLVRVEILTSEDVVLSPGSLTVCRTLLISPTCHHPNNHHNTA